MALVGEPGAFDHEAAAKVREAQCLLDNSLRKGGAEMKKVARKGLYGTEAELLAAGNSKYWEKTPLAVAYEKDMAWAHAKQAELTSRNDVWKASLDVRQVPPGYTVTGFKWPPSNPTVFGATGLVGWIAGQFWVEESDFYKDLHPTANKESVDAATKIANSLYYPEAYETLKERQAWEDMQFMHPMYADDARLFLQHGGFPSSAPEPGSMEFRVDVENLKSRFASCAYTNPQDPHGVLGAEVAQAATEWQAETAGQRGQRDTILAAEAQASADLQVAAQAMGESLGQSMIASRLTEWEAYWLKQDPAKAGLSYPEKAEFAQVKVWIDQAQARASGRLFVASRAALSAKQQAGKATSAQAAAYAIADTAGLPRGRGLMYGQQAVQITKASAAAAQAAAKATETASNATRASAADSKTLNALAQTQSHATKAEFRRKAAEEAAAQAKAAAEGAAAQAVKAAENAAKAKTAETKAKAAEADAKTAADDAAAKRAKAEAERDYAKSQKALAETERGKAATAEAKAQGQRRVAADQKTAAQQAGSTAGTKKNEALEAERKARVARDGALEAESNRDVLTTKAYALEAKAEADEGTAAAEASRAAATDARSAADAATTAATNARAAASDATTAATNARAAATRAEGAAKRAQAAADGAKADVAITDAAVKKARAAAADAIDAADAAKWNAITAKAQAETAKQNAAKAKSDAAVARTEAAAAGVDAVRTAGFAYATGQAAIAARDSAAQVIKPANDAIELGSPYKDTDSSAGLAVLTGQAAKTAAEKQAAVAKAKADQAAKAAVEAKVLAAKADADAKAAAEAAAEAADWAAKAVKSAADAQASANAAEASSKAAQKAEAKTVAYHERATADAEAAQKAANSAGTYASEADAAATDAERDAASARSAATAAEGDASTARGIADQAETDATTAEASAARSQDLAKEAQDAATRVEAVESRDVIAKGGATGIGQLFTKQKVTPIGDPEPQNTCELGMGNSGCDVKFKMRFKLTVDFYLCQDPDAGAGVTAATCPVDFITWLGSETHNDQTAYVTKHFSNWDITMMVDKMLLQALWNILTQDFVDCAKGSVSGCLWAASNFVPGKKIADAVDAIRALDAAMKTGVGVADAYRVLKTLDLDPQVMATIDDQVRILEEAFTACRTNSFPGSTQVLMGDGSHRPISQVRTGDMVRATDPESGALRSRAVTHTFRHDTERLVDITVSGGGRLTSTAGHQFFVTGRGWTVVSDLRAGDALHTPDGSVQVVTALRDRSGLAPREVYDLTVDGLHTFFVRTEGLRQQDVLVHNCTNLIADEGFEGAHTLKDHVDLSDGAAQLRANDIGVATKWTDKDTAMRAVNQAFQEWVSSKKNAQVLANWTTKQAQRKGIFDPRVDLKEIRWTLKDEGSLGTVFRKGAAPTAAGKTVVIQLKYVKKHPSRFVVYTSYPE